MKDSTIAAKERWARRRWPAHDRYTTCAPLGALLDDDVLIAHTWNGQPLARAHGGPARVIVPKLYA